MLGLGNYCLTLCKILLNEKKHLQSYFKYEKNNREIIFYKKLDNKRCMIISVVKNALLHNKGVYVV